MAPGLLVRAGDRRRPVFGRAQVGRGSAAVHSRRRCRPTTGEAAASVAHVALRMLRQAPPRCLADAGAG